MARKTIELEYTIRWERHEADGSPCWHCGETCYLWLWRLSYTFTELELCFDVGIALCDACASAVQSTDLETEP